MKEYLNKWFKIFDNMDDKNTYSAVFGKVVLELVSYIGGSSEKKSSLELWYFVQNFIGIYLNQAYYVTLDQGEDSEIMIYINEIVKKYKKLNKEQLPEKLTWHQIHSGFSEFNEGRFFDTRVDKITEIIKNTIIPNFNTLNGKSLGIFEIHEDRLTFKTDDYWTIRFNYKSLLYLFDYKWLKLLIKFNENFSSNKHLISTVSYRDSLPSGGEILKDKKWDDGPQWDYKSNKFIYQVGDNEDDEVKSDKPILPRVDRDIHADIEGEGWDSEDEK